MLIVSGLMLLRRAPEVRNRLRSPNSVGVADRLTPGFNQGNKSASLTSIRRLGA